jgi:hypothetical protein
MTELVDIQFLRASRGVETERILYLVDNGDLLWVFDVSSGNVNRDLRFWSREATAPEKCYRFSLQQVVDLILGQKKNFRSAEIERQWILSAQTMMRLRRAGEFRGGKGILTRDSLADFLRRRWIGGTIL